MREMLRLLIVVSALLFCGREAYAQAQANKSAETPAAGRTITISEGINTVLKDSRLVKIAALDSEMGLEDSLLTRSALLPRVSTFVSQTYLNRQPSAKFGGQTVNTAEKQSLSYGFDVYQTLFDFGKALFRHEAAKEVYSARQANLEAVRKVAVLEFVVGYFDLLEAQKLILVAEKEVASLTSYVTDISHLYEQGVVVKNDLLPAQVRLADARQRLIVARNSIAIAAARLNNMLALPLREEIRVKDIAMTIPKLPTLDDAFKTAQAQRPEIRLMSDQIQASTFAERAKAVENFPVLFTDAGYSYAQNRYVVHPGTLFANFGAKAPLYDGGAARAELLKERFHRTQLNDQKDKLIEDIQFEIDDSFLGVTDAAEKVSVAKDARAQAEENVRVNRAKYAEGSATTTEVLEAINLETRAQTNYYNDEYELKRNYAKLMYSMGIDLALLFEKMESAQ